MRGSDKELQLCAPIAQLVEQMTLNHWVLGSSPRGRTIFFACNTGSFTGVFLCLRRSKSPRAAILHFFISEINFELKNYNISAASLQKVATPPLRGLFCGVASRMNRLARRRLCRLVESPWAYHFFACNTGF